MKEIFSKPEKSEEVDIKLPIEWEALEYEHRPKSNEWYWFVASFGLTFVLVAIFTHNFLLGIFAVLAAFVIAVYGSRKPERVLFSINPNGIKIKDRLYLYENFSSFWIDYEPPYQKELILKSKKITVPDLNISIEDNDPNLLRSTLVKFLKEKKEERSLIDAIGDLTGF